MSLEQRLERHAVLATSFEPLSPDPRERKQTARRPRATIPALTRRAEHQEPHLTGRQGGAE